MDERHWCIMVVQICLCHKLKKDVVMKYVLRFSILLLVVFVVSGNLNAYQNEPEGFRGIKWGENVSNVHGLSQLEKRGHKAVYSRQNDKMKLGNVDLQIIGYVFYNSKFYSVTILFTGESSAVALKEMLVKKHGNPQSQKDLQKYWSWHGDKTIIGLRYRNGSGELVYIFVPIYEEERRDRGLPTLDDFRNYLLKK